MFNFAQWGTMEWLAVGGVTIVTLCILITVVALFCCFVMSGRRNDYQEQVVYEQWMRKTAEAEGKLINLDEGRRKYGKDAKKLKK